MEATRYPFHEAAVGDGLGQGLRGSGSQGFAADIWGVARRDYLETAEPWPLDPDGELQLGLKIEDRHALENADMSSKIVRKAGWEEKVGVVGLRDGKLTVIEYSDLPEEETHRGVS